MAIWRSTVERDVDEEMRLHLELRQAQVVSEGRSPAEARDEARRRFGSVLHLREDSVDAWGWRWLDNLRHDLRDAARTLRRNRGFAASAIAILAIGIAASTGLFAVVDAVVLHPLPYAGADRLARVQLLPPSGPVRRASVTADEFRALRQALTLDAAYIRESFTKTLGGSAFPESVWTESYTGNALSLLGVQPVIGRVFTEADAP